MSILDRAARWEAEANSGFKPERRDACLKEAARLFEIALDVEDCRQRAMEFDRAADEAIRPHDQSGLRLMASGLRRYADYLEEHA